MPWLVTLFPESDKVKPLLDGDAAERRRKRKMRRSRRRTAADGDASADRCSDAEMQNSEFRIQNGRELQSASAIAFCILRSAFCFLPGCAGYQLGQRSLYRPDIRTVHVPVVQSDSYRRYLGERLTEAVVKEIELRTPYKVVDSESADSVLNVRLVSESKRILPRTALMSRGTSRPISSCS